MFVITKTKLKPRQSQESVSGSECIQLSQIPNLVFLRYSKQQLASQSAYALGVLFPILTNPISHKTLQSEGFILIPQEEITASLPASACRLGCQCLITLRKSLQATPTPLTQPSQNAISFF
jgi:hypothetical protein